MLNKLPPTSDKDPATVLLAKDHPLTSSDISRGALQVVEVLQDAGFEAYLVGGCVRDLFLGLHPKDFDVATSATPEQIKRLFRSARIIGRRFRIVHVRTGREITEVTTFRAQHQEESVNEEDGRVLSDNVYGDLYSDAMRRDFTMNALYYDPANNEIRDFCQGMADIKARQVRMIGEASLRYQEDPVRLLRAVRLAAKLNFRIEADTAAPILKLGQLLLNVPAARLFDESLKLLMSGYAEVTWRHLTEQRLVEYLFPATYYVLEEKALEQGHPAYDPEKLILEACQNTDIRIRTDQRVTPAFIFGVILWPAVVEEQWALSEQGLPPLACLHQAMQTVLSEQSRHIAIPRRFTNTIREIWELQMRLPRRSGSKAYRLMQHPRFRAAYDFLLLREAAGEDLQQLGQWWTDFQQATEEDRKTLVRALTNKKGGSRRRPRSKNRRRKPG